jgi:hypothetical protein
MVLLTGQLLSGRDMKESKAASFPALHRDKACGLQQVFFKVRKGRARGHYLGKPFVDPGRDVREMNRYEVVGELVAQCSPEPLFGGIAVEGDDVGLFGFVACTSLPPKGGDFFAQMAPEAPAVRIVIDPQQTSGRDT